ncbi:hypothetical protein CG018_07590 [Gemella sp. ND 6198]|uniref:hypothetical protein n=1 Tax=Gemella sp. ND 6198 TaxID=2040624 RepID=UPI000E0A9644|nr:hypothetical protein [Gemella sp. ND 6198]AXI27274.1 hypothetical protein CG018_07590 [Gemella sp. ND 6198]
MVYKCKSNERFVIYLLNNESRIRKRLDLYLMTEKENAGDNLNVISSKTGRETENSWVKKITNKNYEFRKRCLQLLEYEYNNCDPIMQDIWLLRFKYKYTCERIGYEIGYSRSSVYDKIKILKDRLLPQIIKIEQEVYEKDKKYDIL